jgi:ABC-2 type transport system permease protein
MSTHVRAESPAPPPSRTHDRTSSPEETVMTTTTRHEQTGSAAGPGATAYPSQIEDVRALAFTRLLRTELRKLVDTRAGRWLLVSIVVITLLAMGVTLWVNREEGTGMIALLAAANIPQALLIPILGVMTAANEWSQRTALITFTQEPRRLRVMVAKTLAALLLGLAVLLLTSVVATGAHAASMAVVDGGRVDAWVGWPMTVNLVALQALGVLMGVAFGALFLNVPLGIVAYFLVPTLSPLLFMTTAWLRDNAAWLDLSAAQGPMLSQQWLTGEQWAQIGTTSALWILLPLALGFWRVARREVK